MFKQMSRAAKAGNKKSVLFDFDSLYNYCIHLLDTCTAGKGKVLFMKILQISEKWYLSFFIFPVLPNSF